MVSVVGSVEASPAIISEKKMPIDSDEPELKNVPRMPLAAPRWLAGTEFMIAIVLGAANRPDPMPLMAIRTGELPVGEVGRQEDQRDERQRR